MVAHLDLGLTPRHDRQPFRTLRPPPPCPVGVPSYRTLVNLKGYVTAVFRRVLRLFTSRGEELMMAVHARAATVSTGVRERVEPTLWPCTPTVHAASKGRGLTHGSSFAYRDGGFSSSMSRGETLLLRQLASGSSWSSTVSDFATTPSMINAATETE